MQLVDRLQSTLKAKNLSVLKFSNETGISAYKVYKWIDGKGSPKHEDSQKIEEWLKETKAHKEAMYATPNTSERVKLTHNPSDNQRIQELEEQVRKLSIQNEMLLEMLNKALQRS